MWLTLLWQNKALVGMALCVLLVAGLLVTLKVQAARIDTLKAEVAVEESAKLAAIEAHDLLTKEVDRQRRIVADREIARQQQEQDYARLQRTLAEALRVNRVWADTRLPDGVREALDPLPEAAPGDTGDTDQPNVGSQVPGSGQ